MKTFFTLFIAVCSFSGLAQTGPTFTNPVSDEDGNQTYIYRAQVLNTIFTLPVLRVNFLAPSQSQQENSLAKASFFNSVGAGFGYSFGRIEEVHDSKGKLMSQTLTNIFGIQVGVLFASNPSGTSSTTTTTPATTTTTGTTMSSTSSTSTNIIALHAGISILNFELGAGYELGSVNPGQRRGFFTVAYGIPLSTLVKGAYHVVYRKLVPPEHVPDAIQ